MSCPDCGQVDGVVCRHEGPEYYCWFCLNPKCFTESAKMSKAKERAKKDIYEINGKLCHCPPYDIYNLGK